MIWSLNKYNLLLTFLGPLQSFQDHHSLIIKNLILLNVKIYMIKHVGMIKQSLFKLI